MEKLKATKVLFIKLGGKGGWEEDCIEVQHCLRLGFNEANHEYCIKGDWKEVENTFKKIKPKKAKDYLRQVKEFYTADNSTLWITFHNNKMWWCFAADGIKKLPNNTKERSVYSNVSTTWSDKDINGVLLTTDRLSGKLLKTQRYEGTICKVSNIEYVLNKINGEDIPEVGKAKIALKQLEYDLEALIKHLEWSDFELLVDLIFTNAGWKRVGRMGKQEKTLDLDLVSPVTNEKAWVQIKSKSNAEQYAEYKNKYAGMKDYSRMFYVVHSPDEKLSDMKNNRDNISILCAPEIARLAVNAGLATWIIEKVA